VSLQSFEAALNGIVNQHLKNAMGDSYALAVTPRHARDFDTARWFDALDEPRKIEALREMLAHLPASYADDYDRWLQFGAALRCTSGVSLDALFAIWIEWSAQSPKWESSQQSRYREKWNTMDRSGVGTLIYHAGLHGWRPKSDQIQLAKLTFVERFTSLDVARKALSDQYAYARLENRFVGTDGVVLSVEAFERSLARLMPLDSSSRPISAVSIAMRYGAVPIVDVAGYAPGRPFIYEDEGTRQTMANTFQACAQNELAPTEIEIRALAAFRKHLIAGDPDTEKMLSYFDLALAYLVQHPTERLPKVFLLIGERQGSGKSTYTLGFTRALFGWQNVGKVTNSEIRSNFNEWMTNSKIVCLEEIWMTEKKDARDLVNSLKDNITDSIARIHPKGGKGFQMTNPSTYFASSNHLDAIDLAAGDRRWAIAHTKAGPLDERFASWLHRWLLPEGRGPGVLRYIYSRMPLAGFNPHGTVPVSNAKSNLFELSRTDIERVVYESWHAFQGPFSTDICSLDDICSFVSQQIGYNASRKQVLLALQTGEIEVTAMRAKKERGGRAQIKRLWITRNHLRYVELGPAELFEEYERLRIQFGGRVARPADHQVDTPDSGDGSK
jgi:hypothetical protein